MPLSSKQVALVKQSQQNIRLGPLSRKQIAHTKALLERGKNHPFEADFRWGDQYFWCKRHEEQNEEQNGNLDDSGGEGMGPENCPFCVKEFKRVEAIHGVLTPVITPTALSIVILYCGYSAIVLVVHRAYDESYNSHADSGNESYDRLYDSSCNEARP